MGGAPVAPCPIFLVLAALRPLAVALHAVDDNLPRDAATKTSAHLKPWGLVDVSMEDHQGRECLLNDGLHEGRPWEQYAQLHRRGRAALAGGGSVPVLVWSCRAAEGSACGAGHAQIQGLPRSEMPSFEPPAGLLKAFYIAVQTGRTFFVDWSHWGSDFGELFKVRRVDWQLPKQLNCNGSRNTTVTSERPRGRVRQWPESCVFLASRVAPTRGDAEVAGLALFRPGCAWRFLVRASAALNGLVAARRPAGVANDGRYVAAHVPASGVALAALERVDGTQLLRGLLACASGLLARPGDGALREASGDLPVVVYTDSPGVESASRDERLPSNNSTVSVASGTEHEPAGPMQMSIHSSATRRQRWLAAWADQWSLAQASGVVGPVESGFSRWAVELGLLPRSRVRGVVARRGQVVCEEGAAELW